jgi:hypothetical protein
MPKMMRSPRLARWFVLGVMLAGLGDPGGLLACAVCYGEPSSPTSRGLTLAILSLIVVALAVLGGVLAFFIHVHRNTGLVEAALPADPLVGKS